MEDQVRRVVITGIGAVTPIGQGAKGLWEGIRRERSAIGPITHFDASALNCRIAAEVRDFDPAPYLEGKTCKRLDPCSLFSVAASKQALADSCLDLDVEPPERMGVCIGSALGGAGWAENQHTQFLQEGARGVSLAVALQTFVGAGTCNVAIELGFTGYSSSNSDSCASGTIAIGNAWHAIRRGDADVILAGGSEASLSPLCFGAFTFIRAMSTRNDDPTHACRPFDSDRDGFVMGEGAAVLVLEEREHALRRNAPIYAELAGFAATMDAHHMTAPRPDAACAARCIRQAMERAHLLPEQLDYINAHASSTVLNDSTETRAIVQALGAEAAQRIPISGTKAMHGHALGATGAMEVAICCLAMQHDWIPPTLNLDNPDPACALNHVAHTGRPATLNAVLSNSFGFGGINAAVILRSRQ